MKYNNTNNRYERLLRITRDLGFSLKEAEELLSGPDQPAKKGAPDIANSNKDKKSSS